MSMHLMSPQKPVQPNLTISNITKIILGETKPVPKSTLGAAKRTLVSVDSDHYFILTQDARIARVSMSQDEALVTAAPVRDVARVIRQLGDIYALYGFVVLK